MPGRCGRRRTARRRPPALARRHPRRAGGGARLGRAPARLARPPRPLPAGDGARVGLAGGRGEGASHLRRIPRQRGQLRILLRLRVALGIHEPATDGT
ncbi:hypothetical protein E1287_09210 [Actinomadura sp. KC06]|nr:hypothetical protein E1287_09210 [Actinomadura sp. KC06]